MVNDTGINECFQMIEKLGQIPEHDDEQPFVKLRSSDPMQFRLDSDDQRIKEKASLPS